MYETHSVSIQNTVVFCSEWHNFFLFIRMTYSDDIINLVLYALKEGLNMKEVINRYGVSKRTIYRWNYIYTEDLQLNKRINPFRI